MMFSVDPIGWDTENSKGDDKEDAAESKERQHATQVSAV